MSFIDQQLECKAVGRELPGAAKTLLLDNISFEVRKAEVLGVLGPSGAGKSTLLRLLNRLDEPTSGMILLDGQDYRSLPPRALRRRVGMIMQRAYLFPGTVAENVRFGPMQHGLTITDREIEDLLEQVGLAGYGARDSATLSGGEAQRVAITRALANTPEVLLLDEPTSALDEQSKQGVETLLESLIRRRGLTCVWVTHDAAQAARMADSVLLLEAGRIVKFGPAAEVLPSAAPTTAADVAKSRELRDA
ncbi:YbbL ABC transporter ATP-binding protein [Acidisarcina polymorpha]|uniref:YbbL ABC transporter ATP-binding protein n=1 Tax=Acidisarcina polymorpha TaxID=2211140 RepID=A0A2Z5G5K2_9BACT|nr:phosphate ABC transporter ATP-binding protein [Acidisarcina polymorpha]AXC14482.1 YbbL ABC transporter ATP-binding protein [Acidisarcina polymorpha]